MTTDSDSEKALERIRLMLPRTEANGASPAEVEAAAKHIGRLLMKHPQLLARTSARPEPDRWDNYRPPHGKKPTGDVITFPHTGVRGESAKAILVVIRGQNFWLPKSQLTFWDQRTVTMSAWLARANGLD